MRHIIGYLNKPTKDGRVVRTIKFRTSVPILNSQWNKVGWAAGWSIEDDVITCFTSYKLDPADVLSMNLNGVLAFVEEEGETEVSGELVALTVVPRERWAWNGVTL